MAEPQAPEAAPPAAEAGAQPGSELNLLRNYNFKVLIDGVTQAHFTSFTGLHQQVEVVDFREGGGPRFLEGLFHCGEGLVLARRRRFDGERNGDVAHEDLGAGESFGGLRRGNRDQERDEDGENLEHGLGAVLRTDGSSVQQFRIPTLGDHPLPVFHRRHSGTMGRQRALEKTVQAQDGHLNLEGRELEGVP